MNEIICLWSLLCAGFVDICFISAFILGLIDLRKRKKDGVKND